MKSASCVQWSHAACSRPEDGAGGAAASRWYFAAPSFLAASGARVSILGRFADGHMKTGYFDGPVLIPRNKHGI